MMKKQRIAPSTRSLKTYIDSAIAAAIADYLPLAGGTMTGNINMNTKSITSLQWLDFSSYNDLTISGGSITPTRTHNRIAGEGGAADNLDAIDATNCSSGSIVILRANAQTITIRDKSVAGAGGNIYCGAAGLVLNSNRDTALLMYDGTYWLAVSFMNNA